MSGQSNSVLDDIVGAFVNVGRTLLAIVGGVLALFVGVILIAVGAVLWVCAWVLWKLKLSKISPRQRFQRVQMWLVGKYVQRKMRQAGVQSPGNIDLSAMFQGGQMGDFAQHFQKDLERVRAEQAERGTPSQRVSRQDANPTVQPARSADDDDVPEVRAEEVGEYQGSVEELVKRRRG